MALGDRSLEILECIDSGGAIMAGLHLPTCIDFKVINRSVVFKLAKAGYVRKPMYWQELALTKKGKTAIKGRTSA